MEKLEPKTPNHSLAGRSLTYLKQRVLENAENKIDWLWRGYVDVVDGEICINTVQMKITSYIKNNLHL